MFIIWGVTDLNSSDVGFLDVIRVVIHTNSTVLEIRNLISTPLVNIVVPKGLTFLELSNEVLEGHTTDITLFYCHCFSHFSLFLLKF